MIIIEIYHDNGSHFVIIYIHLFQNHEGNAFHMMDSIDLLAVVIINRLLNILI